MKKADVKHVAKLANLQLPNNEISRFQKQLSEVISYIDQLNEVKTAKVEPASQTTGLTNVSRADKLNLFQGIDLNSALSNAKKTHRDYFLVPHVFEQSDQ